ncbi:MAG: hypothetical protein IT378_02925 [Sandaracinaceae bacterium]|nr:hypothetical protein [Sandaracinaceae bacterium]
MQDKVGKLGSGFVWLFALLAVLIGIGSGYATQGLDAKVSSAVYFGVFLAAGFAGTVLTKARALSSIAAFLLASLASAGTYYAIASSAVSDAAGALGGGEAGGMLGAAIGIFVAVITFFVSMAGGIGGALAGIRARNQLGKQLDKQLGAA